MANPEHVVELMKGVESWNLWVEEQQTLSSDFRADLRQIDLRKKCIENSGLWKDGEDGAFLVGAHMQRASLAGSCLLRVNFSFADLQHAGLSFSSLQESEFDNANLFGAKLEEAQLQNAWLAHADLEKAYLENANLKEASLLRADLREAHLGHACLQGVDFTEAKLQKALLYKSDIQDAKFEYSILREANLVEACLHRAAFQNVQLQGANFQRAHFKGAKLHGIHLGLSDTEDFSNIPGAVFDEAEMDDSELFIVTIDKRVSFQNTRFGNCLISISENIDQRTAIQVLARGIVNNAQFVDPVFGRKVRDQAWLNKWLEDIERTKEAKTWKYWGMNAWAWFWKISSDYGRNGFLWFLWSVCIAIVFAAIYSIIMFHFPRALSIGTNRLADFFTPIYFSVVTMTTLGFGDVTPTNWLTEMIVTLEVILGYVMLGGLISIFATKVARRND